MVRANDAYKPYNPKIDEYIKTYGIGGVCFFSYDPIKQVQQTNQWQSASQVPLLISIDAEWGLGMRHKKQTISYPFQMTLGAITKDSLLYLMGRQIGEQCQRMGIQMNFAPVVDVNNNPNNPVINSRSFGDSPALVAQKAAQYMHGLQDAGLMATAKHFPGHGDTDTDSHLDLPSIPHNLERLHHTELAPFKALIKEGLNGIMIAHLFVPAIEKEANVASTLSPAIVQDLLKQEMGFKGLVVTDGLDMKGVTKHFAPGEIEVRAFLAGNDILLLPANVPAAIKGLSTAYTNGRISETTLAARCKKVLSMKYDLSLHTTPQISTKHLLQDLNKQTYKNLCQELYKEAIILLKNDTILPLQPTKKAQTAIVNFGETNHYKNFRKAMPKNCKAKFYHINTTLSKKEIDSISNALANYTTVLFNIGNSSIFPQKNFGIKKSHVQCTYTTAKLTSTIVNLMASPMAAQKLFNNIAPFKAFIIAHQDTPDTQSLSAKMISGQLPFNGKLPIRLNEHYPQGSGLSTHNTIPLSPQYQVNDSINMSFLQQQIDSLVERGIKLQAFPGCQICINYKGKAIFEKSYGYFTYDSIQEVNENTIYDLASLTKVLASAPALMYLYQNQKIDLDRPLEQSVPYLNHTNKASLTWRHILSHQGRLKSWIPFYKFYMDEKDNSLNTNVFSKNKNNICTQKIAPKMYINPEYTQAIFDSIANSPLQDKTEYRYSDLGYYWVPDMVQRYTHLSFEDFLDQYFYKPMGLKNTFFRPLAYINPTRIPPTEDDTIFRKGIIKGYVHDPGAAMLGGVSGHAGLFSNAQEVCQLFRMYLQKGQYKGQQLLQAATIAEFTKHQFPDTDNRRALCFDKPYEIYDPKGPCCELVSDSSFGHSGFTGTYVWADPEYDLVYVFLSNRTFPNSSNHKISRYNFRTDIQEAIYKAILK